MIDSSNYSGIRIAKAKQVVTSLAYAKGDHKRRAPLAGRSYKSLQLTVAAGLVPALIILIPE
ncbi:MAG: hypothetical protein ABH870_09060 [bacterium]